MGRNGTMRRVNGSGFRGDGRRGGPVHISSLLEGVLAGCFSDDEGRTLESVLAARAFVEDCAREVRAPQHSSSEALAAFFSQRLQPGMRRFCGDNQALLALQLRAQAIRMRTDGGVSRASMHCITVCIAIAAQAKQWIEDRKYQQRCA